MSAYAVPVDWRRWRALEAVKAIVEGTNPESFIRYPVYAEIFEWDEDETKALFHDVCEQIGVTITDRDE